MPLCKAPTTPNQALQRTRSAVTACAPDHHRLSTHRHSPCLLRVSLSLGSLGDSSLLVKTSLLFTIGRAAMFLSAGTVAAMEPTVPAIVITDEEAAATGREERAIYAEFRKLEIARPMVQTYPVEHKIRKQHIAALRSLYSRAVALQKKHWSSEPAIAIHTELNHFSIVIPNEHRWKINDPQTVEPKVLIAPKTRITYYLESDGRHVSAISPDGKILWHRDPFNDAGLWPYRVSKPVITYFEFAPDEKPGLAIGFNSSQFGTMDFAKGSFEFHGQD